MLEQKFNFISPSIMIDRKLYKYYGNVENAAKNIQKRQIHLDNPRDFNDPFEATYVCRSYTQLKRLERENIVFANVHRFISKIALGTKNYIYNKIMNSMMVLLINNELNNSNKEVPIDLAIKSIYGKMNNPEFSFGQFCEMIDKGFMESDPFFHKDCRISCFSEVCDSILMWSYYANSHKGVCVEYDLSKLDMANDMNIQIRNSFAKVQYSPIRIDTLHEYAEYDSLYFKSDVWAHEHEWRIVCETENEFLPFDCITRVYVGAKFELNANKYKTLIRAVNHHKSLKIYKCKLNAYKYQIDFDEIYDSSLLSDDNSIGKKDKVLISV